MEACEGKDGSLEMAQVCSVLHLGHVIRDDLQPLIYYVTHLLRLNDWL